MTGSSGSPVLEVRGLSVRHGGLLALSDVDIDVAPASVAALIGPNGAGKTTFIDAITGFTTASAGHISFKGESIESLPPHERARRGLARTFQSLELFDDLSVAENLSVSASTPSWRSTVTDFLWRKDPHDPKVDDVLDELGLADWADRRPTALSNGQRHRVALARALVARPSLVLLDEPAAGLDTAETAELGELLVRLPDMGTAVLMVDHDMSLVMGVCDTIHVLDFGSVIASGDAAEVRRNPAVLAAYLGHQGGAT